MTTILDEIIQEKENYVRSLKSKPFIQSDRKYTGPSFYDRVKANEKMSLITEIKRASPSKGLINGDVNPVKQALSYEENGAQAISVLTDEPFFKGQMKDLRDVREAVDLPILCKDFIIDTKQIDEAKSAGANIVLLIVAALEQSKLKALYDYALQTGLEVIVEVHDENEMENALALTPQLIGVNNRNLKTFEVDLSTTARIAKMLPQKSEAILIGESGIKDAKDVETLQKGGAQAILIGETLMRADALNETMQALQIPIRK